VKITFYTNKKYRAKHMVLRWIKNARAGGQAGTNRRAEGLNKPIQKHSSRKQNSGFVDSSILGREFGETELNGMFEQVCDSVMPRKLRTVGKPNAQPSANQAAIGKLEVPWSDLMNTLGAEMADALADAATQMHDIAVQYPDAASALSQALERVDHAKRVAMIAQQFSYARAARARAQAANLSLHDVVAQALVQRKGWLEKRSVQARMGLQSAQVYCDAAALHSLVDELVNWAGSLATDIDCVIDEILPQRNARLQVIARTHTADLSPTAWQNIGWFLWHQLAGTLGAKAELEVTEHALSVSVVFAPMPDPAHAHTAPEMELDQDIARIIAGCRVVLILADPAQCQEAMHALGNLQLDIRSTWSVQTAREALGTAAPHAVVYDSALDPSEILQLRSELGTRARVAYVELCTSSGPDFHVSKLGSLTTAHVSMDAIRQSLAPALVFELCKVI
jgi:hypothetical protein